MDSTVAFVGTYTDAESEGIYRCRITESTGDVGDVELAAEAEDPSYLAADPTGRYLYAVNEVDEGAVTAFERTDDDGLERIGKRTIGPADPCYCSVDPNGSYLFVAHYTGGAVSVLPIESDGGVGEPTVIRHEGSSVHPERQTDPHPHSIVPGPDGEYVYVPDLGTDEVVVYEVDREAGTLRRRSAVEAAEGAGPRHFAFDPEGERAYLLNELDSTMSAYDRDPDTGELHHVDTVSTLPPEYDGDNLTADVHVHPSGRFVYGSNRGHDSVAVLEIGDAGLEVVQIVETGGNWPRNFTLSPGGESLYVANAHSDGIVGFTVDPDDGTLEPSGETAAVPKPVCLRPVR